jgi:hypothetical protein
MAKKKKKTKPVKAARDVDDEGIPKPKLRRVREDDDAEATVPKKRSDIFTGLAALSLLALIGSAVFFHLDHEETTLKSLAAPSVTVPSAAVVTDVPRGRN